jgi:hypothetical protein
LRQDQTLTRKNAAAAIAKSLNRQITTAWLLLQTANRLPAYEHSHERFIHSSARVLSHAEAQLWMVQIEQADLVQLAASIERLWFAIDALS